MELNPTITMHNDPRFGQRISIEVPTTRMEVFISSWPGVDRPKDELMQRLLIGIDEFTSQIRKALRQSLLEIADAESDWQEVRDSYLFPKLKTELKRTQPGAIPNFTEMYESIERGYKPYFENVQRTDASIREFADALTMRQKPLRRGVTADHEIIDDVDAHDDEQNTSTNWRVPIRRVRR